MIKNIKLFALLLVFLSTVGCSQDPCKYVTVCYIIQEDKVYLVASTSISLGIESTNLCSEHKILMLESYKNRIRMFNSDNKLIKNNTQYEKVIFDKVTKFCNYDNMDRFMIKEENLSNFFKIIEGVASEEEHKKVAKINIKEDALYTKKESK